MEFTLLIAAAAGIGAGGLALRWEAARGNAADCAADLWEIYLTAAAVGLFGGRLAAMVAAGTNPITNLGDILFVRGGVATGPASAFALITMGVMARRELVVVADALAVAALAGLGGWHLGCLARDACLGTASDLPWAMTQPGSTIGRHPVELYAAGLLLLAATALAVRRMKPLAPGTAAGFALVVASLARFATEPLRPSLDGGPIWWYLGGSVLGAAWAVGVRRRQSGAD